MSRAVPRPVLLSTSSERAGPWGHTAAFQPSPSCGSTAWQELGLEPTSCCAAWGGCVCPGAPGLCEGPL